MGFREIGHKKLRMSQAITFVLLAAAVGVFLVQASVNGKLRINLESPMWAAFFSICGTFLAAVSAMVLLRPASPSAESLRQAPWWNWIGGPLGAMIVLGGAALVSELGRTVHRACRRRPVGLLAGAGSLALLGLPEQPITAGRVLGAALVLAGVVCMKYM